VLASFNRRSTCDDLEDQADNCIRKQVSYWFANLSVALRATQSEANLLARVIGSCIRIVLHIVLAVVLLGDKHPAAGRTEATPGVSGANGAGFAAPWASKTEVASVRPDIPLPARTGFVLLETSLTIVMVYGFQLRSIPPNSVIFPNFDRTMRRFG
jgi:hypothetical protein